MNKIYFDVYTNYYLFKGDGIHYLNFTIIYLFMILKLIMPETDLPKK